MKTKILLFIVDLILVFKMKNGVLFKEKDKKKLLQLVAL